MSLINCEGRDEKRLCRSHEYLSFYNPFTDGNMLLDFLFTIGSLKRIKRTGWINHSIKEAESISDHMHRMTLIAMSIEDKLIDKNKLVLMAAVHDLAEAIVGDITPNDGISNEEKHEMELNGIRVFKEQLNNSKFYNEIETLWLEYEAAMSPEALLCKDIDKFEMICTAFEYEQAGYEGLEAFFESTRGKFQHPEVIKLVEELYCRRLQFGVQGAD